MQVEVSIETRKKLSLAEPFIVTGTPGRHHQDKGRRKSRESIDHAESCLSKRKSLKKTRYLHGEPISDLNSKKHESREIESQD